MPTTNHRIRYNFYAYFSNEIDLWILEMLILWVWHLILTPDISFCEMQLSSGLTLPTLPSPKGQEGTYLVGTSGKTKLKCIAPSRPFFPGEQAAYRFPLKVSQERIPTFWILNTIWHEQITVYTKTKQKQIFRIVLHYVTASQMLKHITMLILPIKFSLTSGKKQHKPDTEVARKTLKLGSSTVCIRNWK